jgi:hypothetical protein
LAREAVKIFFETAATVSPDVFMDELQWTEPSVKASGTHLLLSSCEELLCNDEVLSCGGRSQTDSKALNGDTVCFSCMKSK